MLAQPFVTVLAAPPHMRGPMLPILPDSCFPGYRTGAFGAPEYSLSLLRCWGYFLPVFEQTKANEIYNKNVATMRKMNEYEHTLH